MMFVLEGVLFLLRFLVGACIFSFLNVVIYRLPLGESVVKGRSHCPDCGRSLTPAELIPLVSFLAQGRRCKGCGQPISWRYFWVECMGGAAIVCCGAFFGYGDTGLLSLRGAAAFLYIGILTVVAFIDWDTQLIYNRFSLMILALGTAALWLFPEHGVWDRGIGFLVVAAPMLVLTLIIPGAFGGGDIKLMAASGWLLGWRATVCAMFFALLGGGAYGIWMLARRRLGRKDHFAFGPFLAAGLILALFCGDGVAAWYLGFL